VIGDCLALDRIEAGAVRALDAYPTDFVLTNRQGRVAKVMDSQRDWRLIYRDDAALLYARADSPAARLDGIPFTGTGNIAFFP
jgi:hypothetical protein